METYILKVDDTFEIEKRGIIVVPDLSSDKYRFDQKEQIKIIKPDGTELNCEASFQISFVDPVPKQLKYTCLIHGILKNDVPIGSKIFVCGKSHDQISTETNNGSAEQHL